MAAGYGRWWLLAIAGAFTLSVAVVACGGEGGNDDETVGRVLDPGGFLAAFEQEACRAASVCGGENDLALAGCGFAVALGDTASCRGFLRERSTGLAAGFAAGELCYYGPPRGFVGTAPTSRCLDDLRAIQAADDAACVSGAAATDACEGTLGDGGGATAGELDGVLALPVSCRCAFVPVGNPLPAACVTLLAETDLARLTEQVGAGEICGETSCNDCRDDDGNGAVDCADRSCASSQACASRSPTELSCGNGLDDDGDCRVDCADDDCAESPACVGAGGTGGAGGVGGAGGAGGIGGTVVVGGSGGSGGTDA